MERRSSARYPSTFETNPARSISLTSATDPTTSAPPAAPAALTAPAAPTTTCQDESSRGIAEHVSATRRYIQSMAEAQQHKDSPDRPSETLWDKMATNRSLSRRLPTQAPDFEQGRSSSVAGAAPIAGHDFDQGTRKGHEHQELMDVLNETAEAVASFLMAMLLFGDI
ncbi:unnamed protein product [Sympodiomycopsis kandeliae]